MVLLVALTLLHGTVRMGPITPVCKEGVPCDRPAAHVALTFTHGRQTVRVTTDVRGRYRVRLAPGVWSIDVRVGMRVTPATFRVPRAATTTRNFEIDTGIR